ncbi:MAG: tRNA (adenosine(37)-N6)-threonylcarbamoyltransferase complex dimerization subunit type 1 TsaB [Spirochaetes bacterium]|nr:tRNA (adenosine(37)-N6)-threonylcarbamoyltransferase complex dimerization subunit type 1 TsaB [Spirochaetota bacterium]MBU0955608.1 tRNA (adenosine(37)-N6)-threonylcarbamoyltransferase complex dimerization subunit type 1 TsaB [Spirochaetota bacterium]
MNCLVIDCSSEILGVAVSTSNSGTGRPALPKHPYKTPATGTTRDGLICISIDAGYRHAERLMSAVEYCVHEAGLQASELDLLACTGGPGSFTGLRIALSTIKGLALGLGKPYVLVPTLEVFAYESLALCKVVVPLLDAKRNQSYAAIYRDGKLSDGPFDIKPEELAEKLEHDEEILFVGPHNSVLADKFTVRAGWRFAPDTRQAPLAALTALAISHFMQTGGAESSAGLWYLRASDAEEAVERNA